MMKDRSFRVHISMMRALGLASEYELAKLEAEYERKLKNRMRLLNLGYGIVCFTIVGVFIMLFMVAPAALIDYLWDDNIEFDWFWHFSSVILLLYWVMVSLKHYRDGISRLNE